MYKNVNYSISIAIMYSFMHSWYRYDHHRFDFHNTKLHLSYTKWHQCEIEWDQLCLIAMLAKANLISNKHCKVILSNGTFKQHYYEGTVLLISESPRPYLYSKLALFNTSWQMLKVLLCSFSSIVSKDMTEGFKMRYFSSS